MSLFWPTRYFYTVAVELSKIFRTIYTITRSSAIRNTFYVHNTNKKFELTLTKRAKGYNSFCSQTVSQSFRRSLFLDCALQPKIAKINKPPYFGSSGSFKIIDVNTTKSSSLVLVVISSMPMVICSHSHDWSTKRQNNDFYGGSTAR